MVALASAGVSADAAAAEAVVEDGAVASGAGGEQALSNILKLVNKIIRLGRKFTKSPCSDKTTTNQNEKVSHQQLTCKILAGTSDKNPFQQPAIHGRFVGGG